MEDCPHCVNKYGFTPREEATEESHYVAQPLRGVRYDSRSRRDNRTTICRLCGKAEAFADFVGVDDRTARLSVQSHWEESRRLGGAPCGFAVTALAEELITL